MIGLGLGSCQADAPVWVVLEAAELRSRDVSISGPVYNAIWWIKMIGVLSGIGWTAWSGLRPGKGDSRKWYDRTIRAVGA
jgi:hypothetical protein